MDQQGVHQAQRLGSLAYLNVHTESVRSLITSTNKLTCENCYETLILDVDHLTVLQARPHSQALAATLMMMVSTIIPLF